MEATEAPSTLPTGAFSVWLRGMQNALRGERASDVPCEGCSACCSSSQFVHIDPDETEALAHIPSELLFAAPGTPIGYFLLGYDERGRCPMLTDGRCSIYKHRPRTCRTYDCRVFPATGLKIEGHDKALNAEQTRRWRFDYPGELDRNERDAVRAAAEFLQHEEVLPEGTSATSATQLAVLAVEVHDAFLRYDAGSRSTRVVTPDIQVVRVALTRRTRSSPRRP